MIPDVSPCNWSPEIMSFYSSVTGSLTVSHMAWAWECIIFPLLLELQTLWE